MLKLTPLRSLNYNFKLIRRYSRKSAYNLTERAVFQDTFPSGSIDKIEDIFTSSPQTIYAGFDPTANSLHVGNLLILIGLLHFQRAGHQPVSLLGGATALIGDPSGRNSERRSIHMDIISENLITIEFQICNIFRNHEEYFWNYAHKSKKLKDIKIVNNRDWYSDLNLVDFIANTGRHFRMGSMLSRSSVRKRLESETGMSFAEFSYQIFQAYDWLHLLRNFDCHFQLGGSDQMGNIMSGHELISRTENESVYGLIMPLITNKEGDKFGKSAGNAIWLDNKKTSIFDFYQFFIRTTDSEVEKFLKLFTFLPLQTISEIVAKHKEAPHLRQAQKILAQEITRLVHGECGLKEAELVTEALYGGNTNIFNQINDLKTIFPQAVTYNLTLEENLTVLQLAMKINRFFNENDAIRIIKAGGFYINQKRCNNVREVISPDIHILEQKITLLRVGKKDYFIIKWLNI